MVPSQFNMLAHFANRSWMNSDFLDEGQYSTSNMDHRNSIHGSGAKSCHLTSTKKQMEEPISTGASTTPPRVIALFTAILGITHPSLCEVNLSSFFFAMLNTVICGAAFGAALTAAGVHQPSVIISQLTLDNFHMVESFLSASAVSAIFVTTLQRLGYVHFRPRGYSSMGVWGRLDGNVVGGLLQGAGMALAAACPGTVFAQVGAGVTSGLYVLAGTLAGGVLWSGILRPICERRCTMRMAASIAEKEATKLNNEDDLMVNKKLGLGATETVMALETMFTTIIVAAVVLAPSSSSHGLVHPVVGGLLIGGAQLLSVITRKTLLGTSTSFEEAGNYFWWIVQGAGKGDSNSGTSAATKHQSLSYKNIVFTASMVLGAWTLTTMTSHGGGMGMAKAEGLQQMISPARAVMGGVLLAVGARMGGGCTSGHGISGISLLSTSSFVTVAAMFAGGIGVALALGL